MNNIFLRNIKVIVDEIDSLLEEAYRRKSGCSREKETEDINEELDDYFSAKDEEQEGAFDGESTESLLDPDIPAPWEKI